MAECIWFSILVVVAALTLVSAVPPTCSNEKKFVSYDKSIQKVDGEIFCFHKQGQEKSSDVCQHPSKEISYVTEQVVPNVELNETAGSACIVLTTLEIQDPEICITYTARVTTVTELEPTASTGLDPGRFQKSENPAIICLVFNANVPAIPPEQSTLINVADGIKSRLIPIEMSSDDGISNIKITDVSLPEFIGDFSVKSLNPVSLYFNISQTITTATDIDINMTVNDAGNPSRSSNAIFKIQVINETITCSDLTLIVNADIATGTSVGQASCESGTLNYTLTGDNTNFVGIDSATGDISFTNKERPLGLHNFTVTVQSSRLTTQFELQLDIGKAPVFTNTPFTLDVGDDIVSGTCFDIISIDPTTSDGVTYSADNSELIYFPNSNSAQLCTKRDLFSDSRQNYSITHVFSVSNKFGSASSNVSITVTVIQQPPGITFNTSIDIEVPETTSVGTVITTFTIQPQRPVPQVSLPDSANQPFTLVSTQSGYELKLTKALDAATTSSYLVSIQAGNSDGMSTATVNITVKDNVAPSCDKDRLEPTVNLTVDEGYILQTDISCSDADGDAINYTFASDTPSLITDHFSMDSTKFKIAVTKKLTDLSVQELKSLEFTVDVSDIYNNKRQVQVNISLAVDAPVCDENLIITVPETLGDACVNLSAMCNGVDSLRLEYSIPSFIVTTLENGDIQICGNTSAAPLDVGVSQIQAVVDDGFNSVQITISLTVTAVNKHSPIFANGVEVLSITLPEDVPVGSAVNVFTVTDQDVGDFGKFTVTSMEESETFQVSKNNITLLEKLNASSTDLYTLFLTATDTGGLSDNLTVEIQVLDVNEPPVCIQQATFNISVLMVDGEVGKLSCYDYDVNPLFKQIRYNLIQPQSKSVPMAVNDEGTLKVTGSLVDQPDSLEFTVQASTGDQNTSITVTVYISRDFPPSCNATTISTTFKEDSSGCSQEKIRCENQVSSPMTWIISNNKTEDLTVQITNDTVEELDIRVCLSQSGRQNLFTDTIGIQVENKLGMVKINWEVNIEDVNDAPKFTNATYMYHIAETTRVRTTVGTISVSNRLDPRDPDILLVDPDTFDGFNVKHISVTGKVINRVTKQEEAGAVQAILYDDHTFTVTSSLKPELYYQFNVQAEDGGNLTASTIVNFMVDDVNQAPSCEETNLQKNISVLQGSSEVLISVKCSDPDFDDNFKSLSYSLLTQTTDAFTITASGAIYLNKKLPRDKSQHIIDIIVKDGGGLLTSSTLTVNVNRDVGAECTPVTSPPNVWLKDECITINSNCVDPTADDTSTLSYQTTGNYLPDFYVSDGQDGTNGILKLCYSKTENGDYEVTIKVENGLYPTTLQLNITVLYLQSVPKFTFPSYAVSVPETFATNGQLLTVTAESTGNFSGNVSYSIKGTDPTDAVNVVSINAGSGELRTTKGLRPYSNQDVKITVQAQDSRSLLVSTTVVTVTVTDINEKPVCNVPATLELTVHANTPIGSVIHTFDCSDPDVKPEFKQLTSELSGSSHFELDGRDVKVATKLPITNSAIDLVFNISDGLLPLVISLQISISFEPSPPKLIIGPVTTTSITLLWSYTRPESVSFIDRHIVELKTSVSSYTVVQNSATSYQFNNLQPEAVYSVRLITETKNKNLTTPYAFVTTRAIPILKKVMISFKALNRVWDNRMVNNQSQEFKQLKQETEENFMSALVKDRGLHGIDLFNMRPGSVIFDGVMFVNQTGTIQDTSKTFLDQVYTGTFGNLTVQNGIVYQGDQYVSSTTLTLREGDPDKLLEGTSIEYACKFRLVSINGVILPIVKWFLDETPLIVTHTPRIKMRNSTDSNDRFGYQYIIQFDKAIASHAGLLKCMVQSSTNSAINTSATETVKIISIPVVTLWPLSTFLQSGESVTLKCSSAISPVTYSWFDAQTNSEIVSSRNKDDYTVSIVDTDVQVYCKGENLAGTAQSPTATIHHTPSSVENLSCRSSTDARNSTWPPVKAGSKVKLTCGDNYNGFAQRVCSESGVWGPPDYSNCTRINLIGLKRETDDVKEGKLVTTPERSLQTLASLTTDGKQFSAGDVEVSVQILMDIVDITNDDPKVTIGKPELKNLAQSASNILDADDEEWITLAEQGKSGIAVMMDTVDAMAKLSSSRLENKEPVTASTDKMVIEIGRSDLSDIEFPRQAASTYPEWLKSSSSKALLRKDTLDNYYKDDKEIGYNAVFYNDISKIVEGKILYPGETINSQNNQTVDINSRILAFSMNPTPTGKLDPPIELSFQHLSDNYSSPTCVFLDLKAPYDKRGRWSTEGCKTESTSNPNVTICKCDHLTNFAILMSPGKTPIKHVEALSIISGVGCAISMCCLLLTIVIYAYLWRYVKSDKAIILMNLCVTLIIAYAIFLGGVNRTDIKAVCQTVAVLLHFFFLVVFFLMLAEGVEVFITLVYVFAMKSRLKWILAGSWGIPVIIVGVSLAITQLEGYGNDDYCWLSLESGLLWAFAGPALAVILVNAIIMIKVLTVMFSTTTMVTKTMKEKGRTGLKALCVLLPIIGLTWVFGVFSVNGYTVTFQFLFAIFNSLQGLFIFIFHCLFNRQVKDALKIKRRRYRAKSIDTGTGTKSFTQVPMNQSRTTSDNDKATNDLDKKTSPFLEADRQVQELAQKLAKVDNNNIKTNANKDNIPVKSDFSIFDNIKIENPEPEQLKTSVEDLYVPVSRISQRKASQKAGTQSVEEARQKTSNQGSYYSDHSSKKSDPNDKPFFMKSDQTLDYPRPDTDDYDHLRQEARERSVFRDYTKLDNGPTQASTKPNYGAFAEPIQRKMPSIEDNSKQTGYFPDPSVYPAPTSRTDLSPTRRTEPIRPAVAPKTKPKPKRIADDEDDKEDPDHAYEALDAHYMGSSLSTKDPYPSKSSRKPKATSSNPNLNQPFYDNHGPKDKWAKMKESKRRGPHPSEMSNQNRRIHSHENLYRSHGPPYQPNEVHILHDARGRPVSRQAPAYQRGWPDGRGGFNY